MLFTFLLVVQAIIAFALVTVILMQRSEGGGLGMGGSPSGLMSARGAADLLSRATKVLATLFVSMSIVLAVVAATQHREATIDTSLVGQTDTGGLATPMADGDGISGAVDASEAGNVTEAAPQNGAAGAPLAQ